MRLTVQFQSVLETFTPHDTVFSFTLGSELTDSALGLCTMLLPSASSLTSSTSSLRRRRRLDEITEDAEEGMMLPEDPVIAPEQMEQPKTPTYGRHELDELPASAVLAKALLAKRKEDAAAATMNADTDTEGDSLPEATPRPLSKNTPAQRLPPFPFPPSTDKALPETPQVTPPSTSEGKPTKATEPAATSTIPLDATTTDAAEPLTPRALHTRHLSVAESDSISQWTNNVATYATAKQKKKKLGPRPHIEAGNRPKTSGNAETSVNIRPVANLPNTIRVNGRSPGSLLLRPGSQHSTRSVPGRFAPPSPWANGGGHPLPSPSHLQSLFNPVEGRPNTSRPASVTSEASTATPEKLRLMKALQLRKRSLLLAQRASTTMSSQAPSAHIQVPSDPKNGPYGSSNLTCPSPSQEQLPNIDEESKLTQSSTTTSPTFMTNISEELSTKASSFTEQDDASRKRRSLSSSTSSSITPRAPEPADHPIAIAISNSADDTPTSRIALDFPASPNEKRPEINVEMISSNLEPTQTPQVDTSNSVESGRRSFTDSRNVSNTHQQLSTSDKNKSPTAPPLSDANLKTRRLGRPQPLRIFAGGDISASDVSEDESLMDELQHATVQQAKPVSVARPPVTPVISKGSSDRLKEIVSKTSNSPYQARRSAGSTPDRKRSGSIRSISTALPQWPPVHSEPLPVLPAKKPTLGTGISKRIKALEVLTTKDTTSQPVASPMRETSGGKSGFSAFMKRSSFLGSLPPPNTSTDTSPPKNFSSSVSQYDPQYAHEPKDYRRSSLDVHGPLQKGDTISVTAKIVRDSSSKHPPLSASSSYSSPLNLFRSPLIVELEKQGNNPRDQSFASVQSNTRSPTKSDKSRFSFSSHRSTSNVHLPRSESTLSKVSHASTNKKHGARSVSDAASFSEERPKASRTSRLMKRMSNLASARHKGHSVSEEQAHPNTIEELSEPIRETSISEPFLHIVDIGDVNVQFPESLLWKRRFMKIDDQGYLIFSPPMTDANMRSVSRKYHLSEFDRPSLPDLEREEMAWSVLLDLKDGRCVQCACESKHSQQQVLQSE